MLVGLAPYLATLHSGATIESRSSIPPASTSIECTLSLEPIRSNTVSQTESLRGPVGTTVVMSIPDIPRGSVGNPTGATSLPTPFTVGHTVDSTVVSTGTLREPGVNVTLPPSYFQLDPEARKLVEDMYHRSVAAMDAHTERIEALGVELIKRLVDTVRKEKAPASRRSSRFPSHASTSTSPPPPQPPSSSDDSDDSDSILREEPAPRQPMPRTQYNRDELMSLLYANLLAEASALGQPEADLLELLRRNIEIPTVTRQEFDAFRTQVNDRFTSVEHKQDEILGAITALRAEIQQSCRPAISPAARHDQDEPGSAPTHPEGETRRGSRAPPVSTRATTSTTRTQPTRKRQRTTDVPTSSQVDIPTVEKPEEDAIFEETSPAPQNSDDEDYVSVENLRDSVKDWFKDPYEPVLKEQDYVHLRHVETQHVEGSSSTSRPLLPHQIRWNRVLQESNSRWANPQFRAPYLEDVMANIFRKTLKPEDLAHIHLILEMSAPEVKEYLALLKLRISRPDTVISRHAIVGIIQVTTDQIFHVEYPVFKVRRQNGLIYTFNEADFVNLDISDVELLYMEMKDKIRKSREEKLGYRALVRYIQRTLRYSYLHDFQRAVESGQRKVHLLKPNQTFSGIEQHQVTSIIKHPFHGVVWMHSTLGEKRFLRFDEIAAYSDGTLSGIRNRLQAVISEDRKKEPKDRLKAERRNSVIEAIELIDKRILYRAILRRFEGIFELRR